MSILSKCFSRLLLVILLAASLSATQAVAVDNSIPRPLQDRITLILNSAFVKTAGGTAMEYCVVTGPASTQEFGATCSDVLPHLKADMERRYPMVAVDYVINGESLNTI